MVIDNDFFFVAFLSELLEKRGFETVKAYDGKTGIETLRQGPVDLLFVDMIMTGIDGRDVIKFARCQFPDRPFPVVAVSGSLIEQLDDLDDLDDGGPDFYVAKGPMDKMTEHMEQLLDRLAAAPLEGADGRPTVIRPDALYPRPETKDLIDTLEFTRAIVEEMGTGLLVVEKDGRIVKANAAALDVLNKPYEQVLNCRVTDLISPGKGRNRLVSGLKKAVRSPGRRRIDLLFSAGERVVWWGVSLFRVKDDVIGWLVVIEDVTGRADAP